MAISGTARVDLPGLEPRGAVRVDVATGTGSLSLVGAHLGLVRYYRRLQLAVIRGHLRAMPDRAVVMGDFNEWSEDRGLEPLDGDFTIVSPGKSFHAMRPVAGLDRLALGQRVALYDAGVEEGDLATRASDHLPVWADVDLADAAMVLQPGRDIDPPRPAP